MARRRAHRRDTHPTLTPEAYRRTVLDPGGSLPGKEIVRDFLGRPQSTEAFANWMNEQFQPQP